MFTVFVDYQMMVARWYAVILARNGSIKVVAQAELLESTSSTVRNALLSHLNCIIIIICFLYLDLMIYGANTLLLTIS